MPTIILDPPSKDKTNQNQTSSSTTDNNDDEDHVTAAIHKTGCYPFHEKLQECYIEKKDWRSCTKEMQDFRLCMQKIQRTTVPQTSPSSSSKQ